MKILLIRTNDFEVHELEEGHIDQIAHATEGIELKTVSATEQDQIQKQLADAEVLIGFPNELSSIDIKQAPNLKWIHSFSAGVDKVLTDELKASDIMVSNSSGVHAIPIAEHVLAFVLIFAKKFYENFKNQQNKQWQALDGMREIRGATLAIIGLGRIGTEIAHVTAGAGMRIIAVDAALKEKPEFVHELFGVEQLSEALRQADYVVVALPHTEATNHLFDLEKFRIMKKEAVFMNIGRGPVVHEQELVEALRQGVIAGAALDVTEVEPLPQESLLWEMENVIITPHHSSHTKQRVSRTVDLLCENIQAYQQGKPLPTLVDKQKGY